MKNLQSRDKKKRCSFKIVETKINILKSIIFNKKVSTLVRWNVFFKLERFDLKNSSKTSISNRCIETNRSRRLNKLYSYSRVKFRKLIQQGFVYGFKKASW